LPKPAASLAQYVDPETALAIYTRALAVVLLLSGLRNWIELLRLPSEPGGALMVLPLHDRVETIAFAVLDLLAAVGLWLNAAWGVALWLIAAASRMAIASGFSGAKPDLLTLGVQTVCVLVYLALSHAARSAAEGRNS